MELYGEQRLQMKLGEAVMRMYKAAPRKVKATIIESLISNDNLSFKDLEEGLGVTRWQWNQAQLAISESQSGKKAKATRGVALNMDKETVEKFVDFCLRPDNIQDVAYGTRAIKNKAGTGFIFPNGFGKTIGPT